MRCFRQDNVLIGINKTSMFLTVEVALVVVSGEEFNVSRKDLIDLIKNSSTGEDWRSPSSFLQASP